MESKVQFISYDGDYPNLCSGTLVMRISGKEVAFPEPCMCSGGGIWFDDEWREHIECGRWSVQVPEEYADFKEEIEELVNIHVPYGCCGGCV